MPEKFYSIWHQADVEGPLPLSIDRGPGVVGEGAPAVRGHLDIHILVFMFLSIFLFVADNEAS